MNLVAAIHLAISILVIVAALPLFGQKVRMNRWYGVRIPEAFTFDARWFEINRYGGKLLVVWGIVIAATAIVGLFLDKRFWTAYDWSALVVVMGGLVVVIARIYRHTHVDNV
jgi:hypothetical protein